MTETEEINARFDAMIARAKLSTDLHNEEIIVRQLAWKRDTDALLREREASTEALRMAIEANRSVVAANTELAEQARVMTATRHAEMAKQARVMIATRHADLAKLDEHRRNIEAIYREGFADIANALKALTTPTIINESGIDADRCPTYSLRSTAGFARRCTRHAGHAGNHCAEGWEWT